MQDSRVFRNSHLWRHRDEYFQEHEYILVDKGNSSTSTLFKYSKLIYPITGYPLTKFSIRPFNDHDLTQNPELAQTRKRWNRELSSLRIFVEHAFGRLKGRFPLLRFMPGRNLRHIFRTVEALMILHNILEARGDDPTTIRGFNGLEDTQIDLVRGEAPAQMDLDGDTMYQQGLYRRKLLVDLMDQI